MRARLVPKPVDGGAKTAAHKTDKQLLPLARSLVVAIARSRSWSFSLPGCAADLEASEQANRSVCQDAPDIFQRCPRLRSDNQSHDRYASLCVSHAWWETGKSRDRSVIVPPPLTIHTVWTQRHVVIAIRGQCGRTVLRMGRAPTESRRNSVRCCPVLVQWTHTQAFR